MYAISVIRETRCYNSPTKQNVGMKSLREYVGRASSEVVKQILLMKSSIMCLSRASGAKFHPSKYQRCQLNPPRVNIFTSIYRFVLRVTRIRLILVQTTVVLT